MKKEKKQTTNKVKKPFYKKWWFFLIIIVVIIGAIGGGGNSKKEAPKESSVAESNDNKETENVQDTTQPESVTLPENVTLYDNAEVLDLMSGSGNNKIGTITVAHAKQADCTEDALSDWYFNYVIKNSDSNYHIIVYDDVAGKGVYTIGQNSIQKDIEIREDENGSYSIGDDAGSTYYLVDSENKTITEYFTMVDAVVVESMKSQINEVIPDEYKNGDLYSVDVSGVEGELDCNLTLISEEFDDADYQSIAEELAKSIKDLNLGIGYFCIAFQSDDYTLKALSNLDNLASEDVTEISTTTY